MPKLQRIKRADGSLVHNVNIPLEIIEKLEWAKGTDLSLEIRKVRDNLIIVVFKKDSELVPEKFNSPFTKEAEVLICGLKFADKHALTQKEIQVLIPFLEKPYTTFELAEVLGVHKTTLHHLIQRLKLKNLLVLKDRDERGTNLYEFNLSQLKE